MSKKELKQATLHIEISDDEDDKMRENGKGDVDSEESERGKRRESSSRALGEDVDHGIPHYNKAIVPNPIKRKSESPEHQIQRHPPRETQEYWGEEAIEEREKKEQRGAASGSSQSLPPLDEERSFKIASEPIKMQARMKDRNGNLPEVKAPARKGYLGNHIKTSVQKDEWRVGERKSSKGYSDQASQELALSKVGFFGRVKILASDEPHLLWSPDGTLTLRWKMPPDASKTLLISPTDVEEYTVSRAYSLLSTPNSPSSIPSLFNCSTQTNRAFLKRRC